MASNQPTESCLKGATQEGVPKGEIKEYAGVDTYITYPPSKSTEKVIVFLPDVFGFVISNKLLADDFAANGYLVVMPDIFDKDPVPLERPEGFSVAAWAAKANHHPESIKALVSKTVAEIKKDFNPKIGAVGYCFGAKYVVALLDGQIDAGYIAHPSAITMEEISAIKAPFSIAASGFDKSFTPENRYRTEEKLILINATYQINLYGGMHHGFAARGDTRDPKQRFAKEQAFNQAISWFREYLS